MPFVVLSMVISIVLVHCNMKVDGGNWDVVIRKTLTGQGRRDERLDHELLIRRTLELMG